MLPKGLTALFLAWGALGLCAAPEREEAAQNEGAGGEAAREVVEAAEEAAPPADGFQLEAVLGRLGNDEFGVRREAQGELLEWGLKAADEAIDTLFRAYRGSNDPEVKFRCREVLKHLVIVKQPWDGEGYLGIQMMTGRVKGADGELHPAVAVTQVREGTAAKECGLHLNDLIVGVDKMAFNDLAPTQMFADYIRSKRPGDIIVLNVMRGAEQLKLSAVLRRRSPLLDQLSPWGSSLNLPEQSELDEADFQEWLKMRLKEEARKKE